MELDMYGDKPQLKIPPSELTLGDCLAGGFSVTAWCEQRCNGRNLDLPILTAWSGRGLLDLMREGVIVCRECDHPATTVGVSSTSRAERILLWEIGDDAMPLNTKPTGGRQHTRRPAPDTWSLSVTPMDGD
jgi:hypothetical protein